MDPVRVRASDLATKVLQDSRAQDHGTDLVLMARQYV
jgi:hypothetical protein